MSEVKKQIILDYLEYQRLIRYSRIANKLEQIAEENKNISYEYTLNSFYDAEYIIRTKDISEIRKEYDEKLQELSNYIDRLKKENEKLKNRNIIQRILNKQQ